MRSGDSHGKPTASFTSHWGNSATGHTALTTRLTHYIGLETPFHKAANYVRDLGTGYGSQTGLVGHSVGAYMSSASAATHHTCFLYNVHETYGKGPSNCGGRVVSWRTEALIHVTGGLMTAPHTLQRTCIMGTASRDPKRPYRHDATGRPDRGLITSVRRAPVMRPRREAQQQ